VILVMVLVCLAVSVVALARLGVSVAATPRSQLMVEPVRYIEPLVRANATEVSRADAAAALLDDAGLIRARIEHCRADDGGTVDQARCLAAVDDALRASPSSGELWLLRATLLAQFGAFERPFRVALRNSYAAAPLEGWIVVPRLGLELRLYPLLPPNLKEQAERDLASVLADPYQAHAFASVYAHDPAMRNASKPAFDDMPPALVAKFAAFVRDAAEQAAIETPAS
jgi:hypothetical protein